MGIMSGLYAVTAMMVYLIEKSDGYHFFEWAPITIFLLFICCIETIIYWLIRGRIYRKTWVWLHIIAVITCFLILWLYFPIVHWFNLYNSYIARQYYLSLIKVKLVGWTFIIGNLFFIITIVKSFLKKAVPANDSTTASADSIPG